MKIEIYVSEKINSMEDLMLSYPCFKGGIFDPKRCYVDLPKKDCKNCYKYEIDIKFLGEIK